jgi:hypothetical protein
MQYDRFITVGRGCSCCIVLDCTLHTVQCFPTSLPDVFKARPQVVVRLTSRTLHAALAAWVDFAHRSTEKDAVLRLAAGRLRNATLAKVWLRCHAPIRSSCAGQCCRAPLLRVAQRCLCRHAASWCRCVVVPLQAFTSMRDYAARRIIGKEHLRRALQLLSHAAAAKVGI